MPKNKPLNKDVLEMARRIKTLFHPERIILFGSHARGDAGPDSDVDLLVVMGADGSKRRQAFQIDLALKGILLPADIIVVTPEEIEKHRDCVGTVIWEALREGKVLYEATA